MSVHIRHTGTDPVLGDKLSKTNTEHSVKTDRWRHFFQKPKTFQMEVDADMVRDR